MTPAQNEEYNREKIEVRNMIFESYENEGQLKNSVIVLRAFSRLRQIACHPVMLNKNGEAESGKFGEVIRNTETLISEGHKILIFSSFVKHLKIYQKYFEEKGISYAMMTGATTKREEVIREFKTGSQRNVFLMSLKTGGVGLNLTEAGYVFLLDPWWNAAAEIQAINRAHRIGQNKPVFAYRFITKNSIEEKILKLQEKKSRLSDQLINAENPLTDLKLEELEQLISTD
jgi:SNF2 family DNA or RNA helicase